MVSKEFFRFRSEVNVRNKNVAAAREQEFGEREIDSCILFRIAKSCKLQTLEELSPTRTCPSHNCSFATHFELGFSLLLRCHSLPYAVIRNN
jgi:hypothetical protein